VYGFKFYRTHVLGEEEKTRKGKLAVFLMLHIAPYFILDLPHPLSKQ
jgi:hypothetical protein